MNQYQFLNFEQQATTTKPAKSHNKLIALFLVAALGAGFFVGRAQSSQSTHAAGVNNRIYILLEQSENGKPMTVDSDDNCYYRYNGGSAIGRFRLRSCKDWNQNYANPCTSFSYVDVNTNEPVTLTDEQVNGDLSEIITVINGEGAAANSQIVVTCHQ